MKPGYCEMTTLLIAEHDNASRKDAANKALTAASQLGADVDVLVAGQNIKGRLRPPNSRAFCCWQMATRMRIISPNLLPR